MQMKPDAMLEAHLDAHPFLKETAALYTGLPAAVQATVTPMEFPAIEECRALVKDGVPLLQHEALQQAAAEKAAASLPDVLKALHDIEAPAKLLEAVKDLAEWTEAASVKKRQKAFCLLLQQKDEAVAAFAKEEKLHIAALRLIGWAIVDALVPASLKSEKVWTDFGWKENFCPVCGRQPVMAQLKKENEAQGAERYLVCGGCHTMWHFLRIGCVYCGNKNTKKLRQLVPDEGSVRIDVCDKCKSYIKTYVGHGKEAVLLEDWATLHLDLLAEGKGLSKKGNVIVANG